MSKNYSEAIAKEIENFLVSDDWKFDSVDERGVIRTGIGLKSKIKSAKMYIDVKSDGYSVITVPTIGADNDTKADAMEYITRANYGLYIGNFEMDPEDGEIRFKTYHCCCDELPTVEQIRMSIYVNMMMLDKYGNGLCKVLFGMATPKEAIEEAEA